MLRRNRAPPMEEEEAPLVDDLWCDPAAVDFTVDAAPPVALAYNMRGDEHRYTRILHGSIHPFIHIRPPAHTARTLSSPIRYCLSRRRASSEWPTSSKDSVASAPFVMVSVVVVVVVVSVRMISWRTPRTHARMHARPPSTSTSVFQHDFLTARVLSYRRVVSYHRQPPRHKYLIDEFRHVVDFPVDGEDELALGLERGDILERELVGRGHFCEGRGGRCVLGRRQAGWQEVEKENVRGDARLSRDNSYELSELSECKCVSECISECDELCCDGWRSLCEPCLHLPSFSPCKPRHSTRTPTAMAKGIVVLFRIRSLTRGHRTTTTPTRSFYRSSTPSSSSTYSSTPPLTPRTKCPETFDCSRNWRRARRVSPWQTCAVRGSAAWVEGTHTRTHDSLTHSHYHSHPPTIMKASVTVPFRMDSRTATTC